MTKPKKPPGSDDEVGYGKPPIDSRFQPKATRRRRGSAPEPLDVALILNERITAQRGGKSVKMPAHEISLRALTRKALKEKSLEAIKPLLDLAREFGLLKKPTSPLRMNGVIRISKHCPPEEYDKVGNPDVSPEEEWAIIRKWGLFNIGKESNDA